MCQNQTAYVILHTIFIYSANLSCLYNEEVLYDIVNTLYQLIMNCLLENTATKLVNISLTDWDKIVKYIENNI